MKYIYGWLMLVSGLVIALAFSGCGTTGNDLHVQLSSSAADINTRLLYNFASAPAPFTSDSQTMALFHLDEISGPTVTDNSANANHGSAIGALSFVAGKFSNAVSLSGSGQYLHVTDNATMDALSSRLTIQAWVFPSTIAAGTRTVVSQHGPASNLGFSLQIFAATPRLVLSSNGTNVFTFSATTTLVANQWAHLAAVVDGNFAYLYVNGILAGKFLYNSPVFNSTAPLRIGADSTGGGGAAANFFNGLIDEVQVKTEAISPPLVSTVLDSSANQIHGQVVGNIDNTVSPIDGYYLSLSGTAQSVQAIASTGMNIQGPWTAEAYVRTTSSGSPQNILMKGSVAGNNVNYGLQITNTAPANRIRVFFNDDFSNLYEVYSVTQLATNTWYHVAGVWDGSVLRVYINGIQEASINYGSGITPALNAVNFTVGRDSAAANLFTGHIDRVRISDIARSSF